MPTWLVPREVQASHDALVESTASPPAHPSAEATAWWQEFDDPVLSQVLGAALESNFDIQEGIARVDQARAQARVASSARLPAVRPFVGQDDVRAPANTGLGAQLDEFGLGPDTFEQLGFRAPERIDLAMYSVAAGLLLYGRCLGPGPARLPVPPARGARRRSGTSKPYAWAF